MLRRVTPFSEVAAYLAHSNISLLRYYLGKRSPMSELAAMEDNFAHFNAFRTK